MPITTTNNLQKIAAKTPQAQNITSVQENLTAVNFEVLDLALGGAAVDVYTLMQDPTKVGTVATTALSKMGAALTLNADGTINYDPSKAAVVQALPQGQIAEDSFTYTLRLANGALSTATIKVTLTGVNDLASISGDNAGSVTEDGTLTDGGTLTVSDVDTGENVFKAASNLDTKYGAFTFNAATGVWGYTLDNAAAQGLKTNTTETLTVESKDGTASKTITVTIAGENDLASISGDNAGSVTEDGTLTDGGILTVSDVDAADVGFQAVRPADLDTKYGAFTFDAATGVWGYTLDNAAAQGLKTNTTETLTVMSADGTDSETITVTIGGENDAPTGIPGSGTGTKVNENVAAGFQVADLNATDVDLGDTVSYYFKDASGNKVQTSADGNFKINATTGEVTTARAFDYETDGASLSFTAYAGDGDGGEDSGVYTVAVGDVAESTGGFMSKTIDYTYHFPDSGSIYYNTDVTVGAGVELSGTYRSGSDVATIDFSDNQIIVDYNTVGSWSDTSWNSNGFNGFHVWDQYGSLSDIAGVSINTNMAGLDASRISFDANNIRVNWEGLIFNQNTYVVLDVVFA